MKKHVTRRLLTIVFLLFIGFVISVLTASLRDSQPDQKLTAAREHLHVALLAAQQQLGEKPRESDAQLIRSIEEVEALLVLATLYTR